MKVPQGNIKVLCTNQKGKFIIAKNTNSKEFRIVCPSETTAWKLLQEYVYINLQSQTLLFRGNVYQVKIKMV